MRSSRGSLPTPSGRGPDDLTFHPSRRWTEGKSPKLVGWRACTWRNKSPETPVGGSGGGTHTEEGFSVGPVGGSSDVQQMEQLSSRGARPAVALVFESSSGYCRRKDDTLHPHPPILHTHTLSSRFVKPRMRTASEVEEERRELVDSACALVGVTMAVNVWRVNWTFGFSDTFLNGVVFCCLSLRSCLLTTWRS